MHKIWAWVWLLAAPALADDLKLASWNIRIYSTGSRTDAELEQIADRLQQFDLVVVQEVRDLDVVARTRAILVTRGLPFQALVSPAVGRTDAATERYALFWRTDQVEVLGAGTVFPDPEDGFLREPFAVSVRAGQFDFTLVTIHSIFGETVGGRRAEAELLDEVWTWAQEADPDEQDILLLGDFNLPADDRGFADLRTLGLVSLFSGDAQTTIADNTLDNIWIDPEHTSEWTGEMGIDRFDETIFGGDDGAASLAVSDHRPLWGAFRTDGPDDDGVGIATAVEQEGWGAAKAGCRAGGGLEVLRDPRQIPP